MKILKKSAALLALVIIGSIPFAGCTQKTVDIKISDMLTETQLTAGSGITVDDALREAEITLGKKDRVTPSGDTVLSKDSSVSIARYATAKVNCDGKTTEVSLLGATVGDAVKKAGVRLSSNDYLSYASSTFLSDGMEISVVRRLSVSLTVDGSSDTLLTQAKTVSAFLKEQKVTVGKNDIVTPKLTDKLKDKTKVVVKRVTRKKKVKIEPVEYETRTEYSSSMKSGTSEITTEGKNGEKKVVYLVTYIDGKASGRKKLAEKITKEPVDEVITQGTKQETQPATAAPGKIEVSRQRFDDCDGSGHGYFEIHYSDGSVKYEEY